MSCCYLELYDPEISNSSCPQVGGCECDCNSCIYENHCWKHWNDCHVKCDMLR